MKQKKVDNQKFHQFAKHSELKSENKTFQEILSDLTDANHRQKTDQPVVNSLNTLPFGNPAVFIEANR